MTTSSPELARFTRDRFATEAVAATGLDDFGERVWQEGLDRYLDPLRATSRLNDLGVTVAGDGVLQDLTNRLRIEQWRKDHPGVAQQQIARPIVIVGQPRTGTSILHDLLSQDPANRTPLSWEVERPVPAPRTETYGTDPRIAECQASFDLVDSIIPGFATFHELGALLAQADVPRDRAPVRAGGGAHLQQRLQVDDLSAAVRGAGLQPVAAARSRHEVGL